MDIRKLRAWWSHRQGLDGSLTGSSAGDVLSRTGWARSVGGSGPYLGLFARGGLSRETVDADTAAVRIHELPSVRGCTYVLPAADYALGLKAGQAFNGGDMKIALKLGITEREIDKLCDAVLNALKKGAMDPDELKQAVGSAVRSLGPEGVKKGISSTMPIALGNLQALGHIRRIPVNGRLDQQRYRYTLWNPNPLDNFSLSAEETYTEVARRYFRWIGPATVAEFQWFSALSGKAAKAAIEPLKLVAFDDDSGRLLFEDDRDAYQQFQVPKQPQYVLTSGLDGLTLLRRGLDLLLDPSDRDFQAQVDKGVKPMGGLADLPSHGIFDHGRVVGLWEYDPSAESLAWTSFVKPDSALNDAVAKMEQFVRTQLGDARSFSLDSPKSRVPRIEALRKAHAAAF